MDVFEFAHPICPNYDILPRQCGEEVNLKGLPRGEINRKAISGPSEEPMFHEANEAHLPETKLG